jgi:nucleoside-diphosphate-sugar epimerase
VSLQGKRVLVLGGTGFVGGRLAERLLLEQGARVRVSVRDWRKAVWIARTEAELVQADVTDADSLRAAARDCDLVFHCASGPALSGGYMRTNREGTANVLAACREAGVQRLVYVSTVAVHAARPGMTLSSDSPLESTGRDYSDSKIEAERLVAAAKGLETVIVRPTYVWGPRSNAFTVRQVREMMAGSFMYVDQGAAVANAVYVDNLVDAMIGAAWRPHAVGRSYLVTDGQDYPWRSLFDGYARLLGLGAFRSVSSRSPLSRLGAGAVGRAEHALGSLQGPRSLPVRAIRRLAKISRDQLRRRYVDAFELNKFACDQVADIGATRRDLGYAPRFGLDAGLAETSRWIEDQMGWEIDAWRQAGAGRA